MNAFELQTTFGNAVKVWRKHRQLTQEELGNRSGLHRTYVSDVERGARNLSLQSIARLAEALEVSMRDFFPPPE